MSRYSLHRVELDHRLFFHLCRLPSSVWSCSFTCVTLSAWSYHTPSHGMAPCGAKRCMSFRAVCWTSQTVAGKKNSQHFVDLKSPFVPPSFRSVRVQIAGSHLMLCSPMRGRKCQYFKVVLPHLLQGLQVNRYLDESGGSQTRLWTC